MLLDFGILPLYTGVPPMVNIGVYVRPYKPNSNKFLHCSDSMVCGESNTVRRHTSGTRSCVLVEVSQ